MVLRIVFFVFFFSNAFGEAEYLVSVKLKGNLETPPAEVLKVDSNELVLEEYKRSKKRSASKPLKKWVIPADEITGISIYQKRKARGLRTFIGATFGLLTGAGVVTALTAIGIANGQDVSQAIAAGIAIGFTAAGAAAGWTTADPKLVSEVSGIDKESNSYLYYLPYLKSLEDSTFVPQ